MTRRKTKTPPTHPRAEVSASAADMARQASKTFSLRQALLGSLVGVYVATPLIPGEAAADYGSGLPLVMLLWLIVAIWLAQGALRGQLDLRFEPVGTAFMLLVGWLAVSVAVMAPLGAPRPAVNTLWEWTAYVIGFRMCLQLIRTELEARAICAVMAGLAVSLSIYGVYQFTVSLPRQRAVYFDATAAERADIRYAADVYAAEGSPGVEHFEQRLASVEPWGTFGLANSLAAFLVPWLVVTWGMLLHAGFRPGGAKRPVAASLAACTLMGGCLLLTKSRAGMLAALMGGLLVVGLRWRELPAKFWRGGMIVLVMLVVVTTIAVGLGGLDLEVLSEAPKSLLYRFEYWQSTWQMILDHSWFGCGLGNFQEYYLQYKLPQASEEIKDPHNFFLEVWANGGTPACLALTAMLLLFLWRSWRGRGPVIREASGPAHDATPAGEHGASDEAEESWCVYGGAAAGLLLAVPVSIVSGFPLSIEYLAVAVLPAGACLWALHDWVCRGELPAGTSVVAVCVSLLGLTFTGGIGYPGVASSIWLLMAVSMCSPGARDALTSRRLGRAQLVLSGVVVAGLFAACYGTAYHPVLSGQDRWDARYWNEIAQSQFEQWLTSGQEAHFASFEENAMRMLARDAHSPNALRQIGIWYMLAGIKTDAPGYLQQSARYLSRAVDFYPSSSAIRADYAWSLHLAGQADSAAAVAEAALQLDSLNPHAELKLQERRLLDEPSEGAYPGLRITPREQNAEQCMLELRREESN